MKHIAKAAFLLAVMVAFSACQKTIEYKQHQTALSDFTFPAKTYGDADFEITPPTSNSPEPFTYTSSNSNVAIVFGSIIKIKGAGITTITATQKASDQFTQMAISGDFKVSAVKTTLSNFPAINKLTTDADFTLTAPKSISKGAFTYTIADPTIATIKGDKVTIKKAGITTIKAEQAASGNYAAGAIEATLTVEAPPAAPGTMVDVDGNVYKTIKIGNQTWMMENLKVTHYRDGSAIPKIEDSGAWRLTNDGAYCSYDNSTTNAKTYGLLYNWFAVTDAKKLAPKGWHIPTQAEWQALYNYIGGTREDGEKLKETGTTHWVDGLRGSNTTGFTGLGGGGLVFSSTGVFDSKGFDAYWWTATSKDATNSVYVDLYVKGYFEFQTGYIRYGLSVRCIKD
ncbi:hypothetical protein D0C36_08025 [Mucilaginibacter conchicola]|uniref:Fibrobacter succinogenes major paralogous domain-containing protein n=1 Tax=Mucilaginibacter conchicola TaxID=2303333 RepID=A0A372NZB5_9SPHI|nr:fibrobacter succinogenes major paralogous domain-containing protein [Mucilaginibacter conchicola]RFZ95458.1 hypothetical protein D0C36_08025 [Mucilaginibacter conchicola]